MFGIRKCKYGNYRERIAIIAIAVVSIANALVELITLGLVTCDWRANLVFSAKLENFIEYGRFTEPVRTPHIDYAKRFKACSSEEHDDD